MQEKKCQSWETQESPSKGTPRKKSNLERQNTPVNQAWEKAPRDSVSNAEDSLQCRKYHIHKIHVTFTTLFLKLYSLSLFYHTYYQHSSYINFNTSVNSIVNWVYTKQSSSSLIITGIQIIVFALSAAWSRQKETDRLTERLVQNCPGSFNILIARSSYFQLAAQYSTSGPKQD